MIAVWVMRRGRNPLAQLIPLVFLLVMTTWALILNLRNFIEEDQWVLAPLDAIIIVLAVWLMVEAMLALRTAYRERPAVPADVVPGGGEPAVAKADPEHGRSTAGPTDGGDRR